MRRLLNFLEANLLEAMVAGSALLLIYALVRRFEAHPLIALVFASSPMLLFWGINNVPAQYWPMSAI